MGIETALALGLAAAGAGIGIGTSVAASKSAKMRMPTPQTTRLTAPKVPTAEKPKTAAGRLSLINTTPQGVLETASVGKQKLLGN